MNTTHSQTIARKHPHNPFAPHIHTQVLVFFLIIALSHFGEHLIQLWQLLILNVERSQAGGLLGEQFPELLTNETLHFGYNAVQMLGFVMLYRGFRGKAQTWWKIATGFQTWHLFEHLLLQVQWLTGTYLFGKSYQTSVLENFFPRLELHFAYNALVTIPLLIALAYHIHQKMNQTKA